MDRKPREVEGGCMDGWMEGKRYGWINEGREGRRMDGWVDEGIRNGWMGGKQMERRRFDEKMIGMDVRGNGME